MKKFFIEFVTAVSSKKGRWITLAVWVLLVAILTAVFPSVNKETDNGAANLPDNAMSVKAEKIAKEQYPDNTGTPLLIVWHRTDGLTTQDYQKISSLYQHLEKHPLSAQNFLPPLGKLPPQGLQASASEDGQTIVTPIFMDKKAATEELDSNLSTLKKHLSKVDSKSLFDRKISDSGLHVRFTGPVGISTDATALFSKADVTLLIGTVLLVLILLVLLYRSPLLALVPLIGVGFAYGVTNPLLGFLAKEGFITVDSQAVSIMTVLLFGAGTDYCLFLVSKYRECLLEEEDKFTALEHAIKHSGGAILVSALTVVLSLSTLLLAQYGSFHRFAVPFSLVILIMGMAALTLLPALLGILGRAAFYPFIPRTEEMSKKLEEKKGKKVRRIAPHGKFSRKIGNWVTRKPWTVIILSVVLLGALASFVPRIQYTQDLIESFPKDMPSREGFDLMSEHFSQGKLAPLQLIINTEGKKVEIKDQLSKLSYIEEVSEKKEGVKNKEYHSYDITLKEDPYSMEAVDTIPKLNKKVSTILKDSGVQPQDHLWIGGETSKQYDTVKTTERDMKVIVPTVIVIIAALLLMYLRSIVAMVYLILTVLLSYLSALGAGWILVHDVLGISAIQGLIPLYSFVFLVALGEDYNIFMISSIWKNKNKQSNRLAIANGVSETSSVITSAGLILAGTFAVLATLPIQVLLQFGIVTAIGVLLDTFVVRPLLVPAITAVLGRYAYWPGHRWKMKDSEEE
ncbi:MMPL family transporter [Rummeliibacillus stabekisii]|uniref:MMPL family transporter n=1 Tax=Rummeliibacillus stabekisii TaxID=241244 RepID=UPI00116C24C8|nr:MMPL family transporter [Rummeliibacillus stabekisii]MBB5169108.1 putative membrane protein YdfJ with MMPL/SSD domain [Rummeliibacillus stabekisii]GEL06458.1 membrane protein [Rummeliibacillus stabekisii]